MEDVGEVGDKVVVEHLLVGAAVVLADRVNQVHQREHLVCWHLKSKQSNKETNTQTNKKSGTSGEASGKTICQWSARTLKIPTPQNEPQEQHQDK